MLRRGLLVAAAVFVLDRISKWWLVGLLNDNVGFIEILPFFNLVMVWNSGVSFGMFQSNGLLGRVILSALALAIVALLVRWLSKAENSLLASGLGLVIGGALGNVIDRLVWGAVADFFDAHLAGWHWPAFNIADAAIVIGAALLIYDGLFGARGRDT